MEKDVEFDAAANGIVGLETAFPVCLDLVRAGRALGAAPRRGADAGPARAFGLAAGTLALGAAADVAVLDPDGGVDRRPRAAAVEGPEHPVEGQAPHRALCHTIVGGRIVHEEGRAER